MAAFSRIRGIYRAQHLSIFYKSRKVLEFPEKLRLEREASTFRTMKSPMIVVALAAATTIALPLGSMKRETPEPGE
jgi:hypothetical protein